MLYREILNESIENFDYTKDVLGIKNEATCIEKGYTWQNSPINFDSVLKAYLALLQVVSKMASISM